MDISSNLSHQALSRRKNYENGCVFIAMRRDDGLFREIPFEQLIPLAFHTSPSILSSCKDIKAIVKDVSQLYNKDNLFSDWQRYCKALKSPQRAVAVYEGAIYFAAEMIPRTEEQATWVSSCAGSLQSLKRLSCIDTEVNRTSLKRKRSTVNKGHPNASTSHDSIILEKPVVTTKAPTAVNFQVGNASCLDSSNISPISQTSIAPVSQPSIPSFTAKGAHVHKLRQILGFSLFYGMMDSRKRRIEDTRTKITDAVRLHPAYEEGEDFRLEIWLASSIGKAISEAKAKSLDTLRDLIGDYLYEAMNSSIWRKNEGMLTPTDAVGVSPLGDDADNDDYKLYIMLGFSTGFYIWGEAYPAPD